MQSNVSSAILVTNRVPDDVARADVRSVNLKKRKGREQFTRYILRAWSAKEIPKAILISQFYTNIARSSPKKKHITEKLSIVSFIKSTDDIHWKDTDIYTLAVLVYRVAQTQTANTSNFVWDSKNDKTTVQTYEMLYQACGDDYLDVLTSQKRTLNERKRFHRYIDILFYILCIIMYNLFFIWSLFLIQIAMYCCIRCT